MGRQPAWAVLTSRRFRTSRESGQPSAGHVVAGSVQDKGCGPALGVSFKGELVVSHPGEEVLHAFAKQLKLRQATQIARTIVRKLREALCKESVAIAGDFENQVWRHLISGGVVTKELRINTNHGALLWRLGICQRRLRVQEMKTDVIDTGRSRCIGQYNDPIRGEYPTNERKPPVAPLCPTISRP
jgi:hypothetical protein